jgi:hypothetical protein
MNVYLAAPYAARDALRKCADDLTRLGHTCTSTWLNETTEISAGTVGVAADITDVQAAAHVRADLADVARSHALVVWTWHAAEPIVTGGGNSGGRHVETGAAMAKGIPVVVIGEPENIFHRAADVTCVADWHEACLVLADHETAMPRAERVA